MNGTSGFQEVRFSTSRSPLYRFLQEQQPQFRTGSRQLLCTQELPLMMPQVRTKNRFLPSSQPPITSYTGISTKREKVPDTIFMLYMLSSSPCAKTGLGI